MAGKGKILRREKRVAGGAQFDISTAIRLVKKQIKKFKEPVVTTYGKAKRRPAFKVLISCLLSLRTRDEQTRQASARLFAVADSPKAIAALDEGRIEKLIYPVGFYRTKAKVIREACATLLDDHEAKTPDTIDELLKFKGVGRKTANLTVTLGYNKPGICVDIHVHRILNRIGYVDTKTPDETEMTLREILPKKHWIPINDILVTWGQNVCKPLSPFCSSCKISSNCSRIGVDKSR